MKQKKSQDGEVVDGLPVVTDGRRARGARRRPVVPAVQAAALAATGFVAGAATVAVVSRHRTKQALKKRKSTARSARSSRRTRSWSTSTCCAGIERPRPRGRHAALGPFRLGPASLDGLTRRRGDGLVRLLHVDGEPVVVAVVRRRCSPRARAPRRRRATGIARMRFARRDRRRPGRVPRALPRRPGDRPRGPRAARGCACAATRTRGRRSTWAITEQLIDMPSARPRSSAA